MNLLTKSNAGSVKSATSMHKRMNMSIMSEFRKLRYFLLAIRRTMIPAINIVKCRNGKSFRKKSI